jgi:hypothetical protein
MRPRFPFLLPAASHPRRAAVVALVLGGLAGPGRAQATSTTGDDWQYACDGTDAELLAAIDEAFRTRVGYGETWDESVCNQGALVLGEGVPLRPRVRRPAPAPEAGPTAPAGSASSTAAATATSSTNASTTAAAAAAATATSSTTPTPGGAGAPAGAPARPVKRTLEQRMEDQFFALAIPVMAAVAGLFSVVVAALIGLFLRLRRQVVLDVACPACAMSVPWIAGESPQLFCPACGCPCRVDVVRDGGAVRAHAVPL